MFQIKYYIRLGEYCIKHSAEVVVLQKKVNSNLSFLRYLITLFRLGSPFSDKAGIQGGPAKDIDECIFSDDVPCGKHNTSEWFDGKFNQSYFWKSVA